MQYRLLMSNETLKEKDEILIFDTWFKVNERAIGLVIPTNTCNFRRPVTKENT